MSSVKNTDLWASPLTLINLSLLICKMRLHHLPHRVFEKIKCDNIFENSVSGRRYLKNVGSLMRVSLGVSKRAENLRHGLRRECQNWPNSIFHLARPGLSDEQLESLFNETLAKAKLCP